MFKSIKKVTYVNRDDNMTDAVVRGVVAGLAFVGLFNMIDQSISIKKMYDVLKEDKEA